MGEGVVIDVIVGWVVGSVTEGEQITTKKERTRLERKGSKKGKRLMEMRSKRGWYYFQCQLPNDRFHPSMRRWTQSEKLANLSEKANEA